MKSGRAAILAVAALVVGASGIAVAQTALTPAQTVEYRQAQLRRLGAAFKAVNDQSRASSPDFAAIRSNAQTIASLAAEFPTWFPAGTGPAAGLDTKAKAEIWSNNAGFADEVRQLQAAADGLVTVSAGTDAGVIGASARTLGQRCASCHTGFRERS